ncbi:MAG: glycosyltransferase family 4 protein [Bacteroidota bacterium]
MHQRVVIIQRRLTQYRKPFFELLRKKLRKKEIDLVVIYGIPNKNEQLKEDNVTLDWGIQIANQPIEIRNTVLLWQPALRYLNRGDLVIVEQASKLLINYVLLFCYKIKRIRLAYWGHGRNLQGQQSSLNVKIGEGIKKQVSQQVHWWFAYNDLSAKIVRAMDFPSSRITSVQNTVDTEPFTKYRPNQEEISWIREKYKIFSVNTCIFSGSLYREKRILFLLSACNEIRKSIPDFEMIVIGAGSQKKLVEEATRRNDWLHYLGPKFGKEKIELLSLAKLLLMPGLVGLAVIDAFASETPLVTTNINYHSPEIDYIVDRFNGIIISESKDYHIYAHKVASILKDDNLLSTLRVGCQRSTEQYTLENMVSRFANGIVSALNTE